LPTVSLTLSMSVQMYLNIITRHVLLMQGHKVARLDGTIRHIEEREQIIKRFSQDKSYSMFLLTTQVWLMLINFTYSSGIQYYQ